MTMDFQSAMETFAEAWVAANTKGAPLSETGTQSQALALTRGCKTPSPAAAPPPTTPGAEAADSVPASGAPRPASPLETVTSPPSVKEEFEGSKLSTDINQGNGQQVYQYYAVVNVGNTVLPGNQTNVQTEGDGQPVLFLTFGQEEEPEEDVPVEDEEDSDQESIEDSESKSFLSNLKLITLEDGRMFVTTVDDNEVTVAPNVLTNKSREDAAQASTSEDQQTETNETEYQEIELEDGTRAIIDVNVWNTLLENIRSNEVKSEDKEARKEKKFSCRFNGCEKMYTTAHHVTVHMRNHTGYRPYQCTVKGCEKAFSTGYSLKAHTRTHTGEKPYGCTLCGKHFKTSGDLQKHIRTHTGERPFKCPIEGCGRSFTTSNIRKVHIRSHTGERPYICDYPDCGKAFASATNHKNHVRIHSGEKPYVCSFQGCGKRFTEYSSLYKHNSVHQPFKPFMCNVCGIHCKQESTLRTHKKMIHNMLIMEDGTEITLNQQNSNGDEIVLEVTRAGVRSEYLYSDEDADDEGLFLKG